MNDPIPWSIPLPGRPFGITVKVHLLFPIVAVGLNVPLMAWLVGPMGVGGLALALSVTASLEVLGLLWALRSRLRGLDGAALLSSLARSTAAAAVAALAMFGGLQLTDAWFPSLLDHAVGRLAVLLVLSVMGGAAFLAVAALLRSPEIGELRRLFGRRFSPAEIIQEEP